VEDISLAAQGVPVLCYTSSSLRKRPRRRIGTEGISPVESPRINAMFGRTEIGLALDSRECVVLSSRRRGEVEETRHPALAQVREGEIRAVGQKAFRLVGKSRDVISVFPGRVEDPKILGGYLQRVVPRDTFIRRRLWASAPTGSGMQALFNLRHCFEGSIRPKETVLVPEILAAAVGCGFPVLRSEEDSHRARMVVHVGANRVSGGVFVDGGLAGLVVKEGGWDQLTREVQENLQFRLGATLGFTTYFKVVRSLSRTYFERTAKQPGVKTPAPSAGEPRVELALQEEDALGELGPEPATPTNLRAFNEHGLIEYFVEDEVVSRSIDLQLRSFLFDIEKVVFGCFARLRNDGRGEIASDLFSDRVMVCGDVFFDAGQLSQHFVRLSRFRFETTNGNAVARGLRRILASTGPSKAGYRDLSRSIHDESRFLASAV
jgi:actin-like ATPase involved in cell morphogenesis